MNNLSTILKYSTILMAFSLFSNPVKANEITCTPNKNCADLGYTTPTTDCVKNILKCPFDTTLAICDSDDGIPIDCDIGSILYENKKCYEVNTTTKTAIGIVVSPESKLAIALDNKRTEWALGADINTGGTTDNPYMPNCQKANIPDCTFDGRQATDAILRLGKEKGYSFPAAEYCNNYKTLGTKAGEWFLPSTSEYNFIVSSLRYHQIVNNALLSIKRPIMEPYDGYWTSNESKSDGAWLALGPAKWGLESATHWMEHGKYETEIYVRPMINYGI